MSCITAPNKQLSLLADAIALRVGSQRFHVWFNNSTRLDLKNDGLEITVPNDFISEWIGRHFTLPIQDAAKEVFGGPLTVRFSVMPQLFEVGAGGGTNAPVDDEEITGDEAMPTMRTRQMAAAVGRSGVGRDNSGGRGNGGVGTATLEPLNRIENLKTHVTRAALMSATAPAARPAAPPAERGTMRPATGTSTSQRLRHDVESFIVGHGNQLAYNAALYVAEFPGAQYNPLFIHGGCGLGKTHLLQGLCRRFQMHHPTRRWTYMTGEEFTNEFLTSLRANKLDVFRRRLRDLDMLAIDDVHFLGGKKATQEEFLHTFNAIEAMGKQVVMASDSHPKMIEEFGESLVNRFVSGMVVRVDPPNYVTRCEILRSLALRTGFVLSDEVTGWISRRVTQNVRELEGAITRMAAHVRMTGRVPDVAMAQEALGDLDRQLVAPVKPEAILQAICNYFGVETKDLMSSRRQRTISLARSVAMYLVRKTAKLSFPEIGQRMGKRNHSTVISACRRIERAVRRNEALVWTSAVGERTEEAAELVQRLEEHGRAVN